MQQTNIYRDRCTADALNGDDDEGDVVENFKNGYPVCWNFSAMVWPSY